MSKEQDEVDEILEAYRKNCQRTDDYAERGMHLSQTQAKSALLTLIADREREARIDTISDMIIECYDHDSPMDIAKELEQERAKLQAEDKGGRE